MWSVGFEEGSDLVEIFESLLLRKRHGLVGDVPIETSVGHPSAELLNFVGAQRNAEKTSEVENSLEVGMFIGIGDGLVRRSR